MNAIGIAIIAKLASVLPCNPATHFCDTPDQISRTGCDPIGEYDCETGLPVLCYIIISSSGTVHGRGGTFPESEDATGCQLRNLED